MAQELPAAGVVLGDLVREIPCPVGIRGCFRGGDDRAAAVRFDIGVVERVDVDGHAPAVAGEHPRFLRRTGS